MNPVKLIECRADLLRHMTDHPDPFFMPMLSSMGLMEPKNKDFAAYVTRRMTQGIRAADLFYVKPDMVDLLSVAAAKLPAEQVWDDTYAPSPWGLCHLEKALRLTDVRGRVILVHWLTWVPVTISASDPEGDNRTGFLISFYNDVSIEPDHYALALKAELYARKGPNRVYEKSFGRWGFGSMHPVTNGSEVGGVTWEPNVLQYEKILSQGDTPHAGENPTRYVMALWMLLNQEIPVTSVVRGSKTRQPKRMKMPESVTVINLRRRVYSDPDRSNNPNIEWQHRWYVKGHWRNQQYKGEEGAVEYKRIWIDPFIKGPEGLPIKQTKKVYKLAR